RLSRILGTVQLEARALGAGVVLGGAQLLLEILQPRLQLLTLGRQLQAADGARLGDQLLQRTGRGLAAEHVLELRSLRPELTRAAHPLLDGAELGGIVDVRR